MSGDRRVARRQVLRWAAAAPAVLSLPSGAFAQGVPAERAVLQRGAPELFAVTTAEGAFPVARYPGSGLGPHPAVLILHGGSGVSGPGAPDFAIYARMLAERGIDAYILAYYTDRDSRESASPDRQTRLSVYRNRLRGWTVTVRAAVDEIARRSGSGTRIGLLGFSQGAFLSVASAGTDDRIAGLVEAYGGMPGAFRAEIRHLPPLLVMHGMADRIVPVADGQSLVEIAKRLGAPVETAFYPGRGHGFDFEAGSPDAALAREKAVAFLERTLRV